MGLPGSIGEGPYKTRVGGVKTKSYEVWRCMLRRCYDPNVVRYPSYGGRGVVVADSWKCFQVFARWYENQYTVPEAKYHLDKDFCGGMIYSEDCCLLVPDYLNGFVVDTHKNTAGKGWSKNRLAVSVLGKQYQLPNLWEGEDSTTIYYYIKHNILLHLLSLSLNKKHISLKLKSKAEGYYSKYKDVYVDKRFNIRCESIKVSLTERFMEKYP